MDILTFFIIDHNGGSRSILQSNMDRDPVTGNPDPQPSSRRISKSIVYRRRNKKARWIEANLFYKNWILFIFLFNLEKNHFTEIWIYWMNTIQFWIFLILINTKYLILDWWLRCYISVGNAFGKIYLKSSERSFFLFKIVDKRSEDSFEGLSKKKLKFMNKFPGWSLPA